MSGDILGGQGFYPISSTVQDSPHDIHPAPNVNNTKMEKLWLNVKASTLITLLTDAFLLFLLIISPASLFPRMT